MAATRRCCPMCGYSVVPERVKVERKHFNGHALQCVRCCYRTETVGSFISAARLWDERGAETGVGVLREKNFAQGGDDE